MTATNFLVVFVSLLSRRVSFFFSLLCDVLCAIFDIRLERTHAMRHDGFYELSQGDHGSCMESFYPSFHRHCMDIIDSGVVFLVSFSPYHDRFPVRYPDLLCDPLFLSSRFDPGDERGP